MSKLFDPKFASKLNTMETFNQTSKTNMANKDRHKAYKPIDYAKSKNIALAHMPMSKLNDLFIKHNNFDIQIEDKDIKRTKESIYGTKEVLITSNTYSDKLKTRNIEYDLNYTDNYSLFNSNKEQSQENWYKINQDIEQASLKWAEQWKIVAFKNHFLNTNTKETEKTKDRMMPSTKNNKNANPREQEKIKPPGINSKTDKDEIMQTEEKKTSHKIKDSIPNWIPNDGMNQFKRTTLSNYKYIDKITPHWLMDHRYKPKLYRSATILSLWNKHTKQNRLNYWSKSYSWYIGIIKNKHNCLYYNRSQYFRYSLKQYKFTVFHVANFIFNGLVKFKFIDYNTISWRKITKTVNLLYRASKKIYTAARILAVIKLRSSEKLNKKIKFKFRKIFEPPPNDRNLNYVTVPSY